MVEIKGEPGWQGRRGRCGETPMKWWADDGDSTQSDGKNAKDDKDNADTEHDLKKGDKGMSQDGLQEDPKPEGIQERRAATRNTNVQTPTSDEFEVHARTQWFFAGIV